MMMLPATPQRTADAHDAAGDGVGGRDRYAEEGRGEKHDRAAELGADALAGRDPGDLRSHGVDDPPAAHQRAETHCSLAGEDHPERNVEMAAEAMLGVKQDRDDPHRLLGVVAAMAQ